MGSKSGTGSEQREWRGGGGGGGGGVVNVNVTMKVRICVRGCHLLGVRRRVEICNASNPSLAEPADT
jgi:hypothetical protein